MAAPASPTLVTRFAPSPTGRLHRGHAFSALTAQALAREADGRLILRIEDIDRVRSKPEYEAAILDDLAWLGVDWKTPIRRQSEHLPAYAAALERLRGDGLVYRCFKTRREVLDDIGRAPHGRQAPYMGAPLPASEEKARLNAGEPFAWRLSLTQARAKLSSRWGALHFIERGEGPNGESGDQIARPERAGDIILARKDVGVAYHLAVVIDDAEQGVTDVSRGNDLFAAVDSQRLLQALLGLPTPIYHHHRLLLRPDGKRFAKRDRAESLADLRSQGVTAEALRAELGFG
jgi:glutamyl-Q tRNA(Asp) synthetase